MSAPDITHHFSTHEEALQALERSQRLQGFIVVTNGYNYSKRTRARIATKVQCRSSGKYRQYRNNRNIYNTFTYKSNCPFRATIQYSHEPQTFTIRISNPNHPCGKLPDIASLSEIASVNGVRFSSQLRRRIIHEPDHDAIPRRRAPRKKAATTSEPAASSGRNRDNEKRAANQTNEPGQRQQCSLETVPSTPSTTSPGGFSGDSRSSTRASHSSRDSPPASTNAPNATRLEQLMEQLVEHTIALTAAAHQVSEAAATVAAAAAALNPQHRYAAQQQIWASQQPQIAQFGLHPPARTQGTMNAYNFNSPSSNQPLANSQFPQQSQSPA